MGSITKPEVIKVLTIIAAMYPRFEVSELKVNLWFDMIGDLPFQVVQMAVKKVMMTSEFPPTVAEVRKAAADIMHTKDDLLDAGKAWGEVQRAISKYGYYQPEEALNSLSPVTKKVAEQISWREICLCEEPGVIRGQFMKMYGTMQHRYEQERTLPEAFKKQMDAISGSIGIGLLESAATED